MVKQYKQTELKAEPTPSLTSVDNPSLKHNKKPSNPTPFMSSSITFFTLLLSIISSLSGFLYGYDTGCVTGILVMEYIEMNHIQQQAFVGLTIIMSMLFCLIAGATNQYIGPKYLIAIGSGLFIIGYLILTLAQNMASLFISRIFIGSSIGISITISPMYLAECSNKFVRGRMVSMLNSFVVFGQFIALLFCYIFSQYSQSWRIVTAFGLIPAILQLVSMLAFLPQSPVWLVSKNKLDEAMDVLKIIYAKRSDDDEDYIELELELIKKEIEEKQQLNDLKMHEVLKKIWMTKHVRKALFLGISLHLITHISGIGNVMYYNSVIIQKTGIEKLDTIFLIETLIIGVYSVASIVGGCLMDKLGRRTLALYSLFASIVGLIVIGSGFLAIKIYSPVTSLIVPPSSKLPHTCAFSNNCDSCLESKKCIFCYEEDEGSFCYPSNYTRTIKSNYARNKEKNCSDIYKTYFIFNANENPMGERGWLMSDKVCLTSISWIPVTGLVIYLVSFSIGLGPTAWTINSEIYPNWARSLCISIATFIKWVSNLVLSSTFLTLVDLITISGAFYLSALLCLISLVFLYVFLPETKNKRLEEVEDLFKKYSKSDI